MRRRVLLVLSLIPVLAGAGDFVTGRTEPYTTRKTGAACPYLLTAPEKCWTAGNANAVLSALDDLRDSVLTGKDTSVSSTGSTTARTLAARFADTVNVRDYGAKGDGTTDDTAAIQAAVKAAGQAYSASDWFASPDPISSPAQVVTFVAGASYRMIGTVYVPQGVTVDFNGATITGTGYTSGDNVLFETGYYSSGNLVTNWGTGDEVHRVVYTKFRNGRIKNCKIAFHLSNFNEGSAIDDVSFNNCQQNIVSSRSFYSAYRRLMSRGSAGGTSLAAWQFYNAGAATVVNNVIEFSAVATGDRVLSFQFSGGTAGLSLRNCTAENGTNGIVFTGEVTAIDITGNYFEGLTGTAIDLTDASAHKSIHIGVNWYLTVGTGIAGVSLVSGRIEPQGFYSGVTNPIVINDNANSLITVELAPATITSGVPSLPSGYVLGQKVDVRFPFAVIDGGGVTRARQNFTGGGTAFIELPYSGRGGYVVSGIPFATWVIDNPGGTLTITTSMDSDPYTMGAFTLKVADNLANYLFRGRFWGSGGGSSPYSSPTVVLDDSTHGSKTAAISVVGGKLVLTLAGFSQPISNPEGVIRMF